MLEVGRDVDGAGAGGLERCCKMLKQGPRCTRDGRRRDGGRNGLKVSDDEWSERGRERRPEQGYRAGLQGRAAGQGYRAAGLQGCRAAGLHGCRATGQSQSRGKQHGYTSKSECPAQQQTSR